MQIGHSAQHASVRLLRIGMESIETPQPCLQMRHTYAPVKRAESRCKRARRVTLNDDDVRLYKRVHIVEPRHDTRDDVCERLIKPHDVQILEKLDTERGEDLRHHLPVLPCGDDADVKAVVPLKRPNHGKQFDCFRSRAKHDHGLNWQSVMSFQTASLFGVLFRNSPRLKLLRHRIPKKKSPPTGGNALSRRSTTRFERVKYVV